MSMPSSFRKVNLIDARAPGKPLVEAELSRDFPFAELDKIESDWADARTGAAAATGAAGLAPLEHAHWDWRNKADSVRAGLHLLVAVEFRWRIQGIMAVLQAVRPARLDSKRLVYVDYVEAAPWNLKAVTSSPQFLGVGTLLIADAVRLSHEKGCEGRIGLHSLPQAEAFYTRLKMTNLGPDQYYYGLPYFEFSSQRASEWLNSIGEVL